MPQWPLPPSEPPLYPSTPGGVTAPSLSSWQFQFSSITFGAGTAIGLLNVEGLGGLPPVNSKDQAFPRDTGEYVGVDAMGGRDPVTDLIVTANIFTQMVSIGGAFRAGGYTEQPLWFQLPGLPCLCSMVRARVRPTKWDTMVSAAGMWTPTLTWHASDPRLYTQSASVATPANPDNGNAVLVVTNSGNVEVRPVLVLTGPLLAPVVSNTTIGSDVGIAIATGLTIASGDQVAIDCSTPHTAVYWTGGIAGGTATNIYNWIDQANTSWWTLVPGANNLTLTSGNTSLAAGQLAVWSPNGYVL